MKHKKEMKSRKTQKNEERNGKKEVGKGERDKKVKNYFGLKERKYE